MNSIYLSCRMKLRQTPSLQGQVLTILEKNQILPVIETTEEIDGYVWFRTPQGYVANVDEVFYHADKYDANNEKIKSFIGDILKRSLQATSSTIDDIMKALDKF